MRKALFVVEGYHDVMRFKQADPHIDVVSINGSAIDQNIDYILSMQDHCDIVLCFDPDYAGLKIRRHFEKILKDPLHIHIKQEEAFSKDQKKIGFEHLEITKLQKLLSQYQLEKRTTNSDIDSLFLYEHQLIGSPSSKENRKKLSAFFPIGYTNSKSLLSKLRALGILKNEIVEVMHEARHEKEVRTKLFDR